MPSSLLNPSVSVLSSLLLLLMYLNAVSSSAASQQSINTGNASHLWNITPSLTVSAHHWRPHPHAADREEDNTGQLMPWPSINHRRGFHNWNRRCLNRALFIRYELVINIIPGIKEYPIKRVLNEVWYCYFLPFSWHFYTFVIDSIMVL